MVLLPGVVFTFIVVSTYLYVYNVITVVSLGRVRRIFSITRQLLQQKLKNLREPRIEGCKTPIVQVDREADDEKVAKERDSTKLLFVFDKAGDIRWYNPAG